MYVHVAVIARPMHNGIVCACVGQQCTFTLFSPFIVILSWFVEKPVIQATLKGVLIEEENVECRPEKVSNAVLGENVDIHLTRSYFSQDAWMIIECVLRQKRERPSWICTVCQHDLHSEPSIICESCLEWYHFRCVGLTGQPKKKNWFCRLCH